MTISLVPPKSVQNACSDGLAMYDKGLGGRGLMPETILWAHLIARGDPVSEEKLRKMGPWFARHAVDLKPGSKQAMTPGWVAWQLWGGDAGRKWAASVVRKLDLESGR